MASVGESLIALLEAYDVEKVFGIPGVHTAELYRGLATSRIQHITPRHEQGAGFMADGYARVTGQPGVCFVITGPGLSNIATPMLQARADSIPMLVITGINAVGNFGSGRGCLHEMPDQREFAKSVAVFSHTVLTPNELPEVLARAFAIFDGARPGPVHIEIPLDLMEQTMTEMPTAIRYPKLGRPRPTSESVKRAADACRAAKAPVIIVGGGAAGGQEHAVALAERLDAPLVATINGRQLLPFGHPLAVPASASLEAVQTLINDADVVLAFGTELGPTDNDMYESGSTIEPKTLIRCDIDPEQLCRSHPSDIPLLGDAMASMQELVLRLGQEPNQGNGAERASQTSKAAFSELSETYQSYVGILNTIQEAAPGAIIVGDSTQLIYAGNLYFAPNEGAVWFNSSVGFGTLGYALPAALGAKLGQREKTVIAIAGDGGFQFTMNELGTIADLAVPIIIVVWNNDGYGEIKSYMLDKDVDPVGVDLTAPDFALIAQAYGLVGMRLSDADKLQDAIAQACDRDVATLIQIDAGRQD